MIKNTLKGVHYLVLAMMLSQISWVVEMIVFKNLQKALPLGINFSCYILTFLLSYIGLTFYFKKKNETIETPVIKYLIKRFLPVTSSFFGIALVYVLSSIGYKAYFGLFANILTSKTLGIAVIIGFVIGVWFIVFLLLSFIILMVATYEYELSIAGLGRFYSRIILELIKKTLSFTGIVVFIMVSVYLLKFILSGSSIILTFIYGQSFLNTYLELVISGILVALIVAVLFTYARYVLKKLEIKIQSIKEKKSRLPIFSIVIMVLAVFLNVLFFPVETNVDKMLIKEINTHMQTGDAYGQMGLSEKSINEYNLAFSKLYAFKGFLQGLVALDEKGEDKTKAYNQAMNDFSLADSYQLQNPYTPYFRGKVIYQVAENIPSALEQFYIALSMKMAIEASQFQIFYLEDEQDNQEAKNKAFAALTQLKFFYDPYEKLDHLSIKKAEKYLDALDDIEEELGAKLVYKAVEKAKYNDYSGAITDLLALKENYPKDATIAYYLAQYYSVYRNESNNYELVKKYTSDFDEYYEEKIDAEMEIAKGLFISQMLMGANDYVSSMEVIEVLYKEDRQNLQVLSQYAYLLTEFERYEEARDVLQEIPESEVESVGLYYLRALSELKENDFQKSLEDMSTLNKIAKDNEAFAADFDYYLYIYALQFSAYWTQEEAVQSVENVKDSSILYNYLYAVKGWKDKDSQLSNEYIEKVINENNALGYAHYINGINYYEAAVREATNDFSKAEKAYLRALEILPNNAEGYFSLAHCYKKAEENLAALRAFRKVVDLMPFEDHRYDPYGMTVHAIGEINSLIQYEGK